jgi:flagellar hook-basal body complex protein FliE
VRNDINRYLRCKDKIAADEEKTPLQMKKCRNRMLDRLSKIVSLQSESGKTDDEWAEVLKKALRKVDKSSSDFQKNFDTLVTDLNTDPTQSKVLYVKSFMNLIAHVPGDHTNIPFH